MWRTLSKDRRRRKGSPFSTATVQTSSPTTPCDVDAPKDHAHGHIETDPFIVHLPLENPTRVAFSKCLRRTLRKKFASVALLLIFSFFSLAKSTFELHSLDLTTLYDSSAWRNVQKDSHPLIAESDYERRIRIMSAKMKQEFTFPSVEERVRYYLGDWYWYRPARFIEQNICTDIPIGLPNTSLFFDVARRSNLSMMQSCAEKHQLPGPRSYCKDAMNFFNGAEDRWAIFRFGDVYISTDVPVVVKSRLSYEESSAPILLPLKTDRHYGQLNQVTNQTCWESKRNTLFWRGSSTGKIRDKVVETYFDADPHRFDVAFNMLVQGKEDSHSNYTRSRKSVGDQLKYKYLLSMEGNDVATGLKWMLYSNSVVFMALPQRVSWAMEDLLVPFVHYIPLKRDHSNLNEMLNWAMAHDRECQEIARESTKYMENLWASPKADQDNNEIMIRMSELYEEQFGPLLDYCS